MLKIKLGKVLTISGKLPYEMKDKMMENLTFPNPAYTTYVRLFKRHPYHIDRYIYAYVSKPQKIIATRGYWNTLRRMLVKYDVAFELEDKRISSPMDENIISGIKVRGYQKENINLAISHENCTIIIPAGGGKTEVSLEIIATLKERVLILVHTTALIQQWTKRIKDHLNYTPGIVQGAKFDVKEITIASVMTLVRRELPKTFYEYFGMIVLDEAHHCPASSFKEVVQRFPAKYRIGMTADAKRSDGMERYLYSVFGDPITVVDNQDLYHEGFIVRPNVIARYTSLKVPDSMLSDWHLLSKTVISDKNRNIMIARDVEKEVDRGNQVLILSGRKIHLTYIYNELGENYKHQASILTGDVKTKHIKSRIARFKKGNSTIIFATQLADEGLDLPSLDAVFLVFPGKSRSKTIQRCGRVQRMFPGKKEARVYDYVDSQVKTLMNQYVIRRAIYQQLGYIISPHSSRVS